VVREQSVRLRSVSSGERQTERKIGKGEQRSEWRRLMSVGAGASIPEAHCDLKTAEGSFQVLRLSVCHSKSPESTSLDRFLPRYRNPHPTYHHRNVSIEGRAVAVLYSCLCFQPLWMALIPPKMPFPYATRASVCDVCRDESTFVTDLSPVNAS
jgi:hypothetical protein